MARARFQKSVISPARRGATVTDMETPRERAPEESRPYGRRAFIGVSALGLSSLFWGKSVWNALSGVTKPLENALPPSIAPSGWRIYTVAATMPRFDPATWRLRIDGLVEQPQSLSYEELRSLPRAEQVSTFHCVTGWSVNNVHWAGVRFRDLLAGARPKPSGTVLEFISAEVPYADTLTLKQAELHDAMLAYEMNGKPLPREHGAPVRVVIPEMYGYKNVKWVERIVLADQVSAGYWEQRGYDIDAWVGHSNGF
jgi:DMSO/TMAO reductase YedYZ molybdopterin-dependent catalytic subunit